MRVFIATNDSVVLLNKVNRCAVVILLLALCCCKKAEQPDPVEEPPMNTELMRGLPENPAQIDAYLYAAQVNIHDSTWLLYLYATFSDTRKNLWLSYDHEQTKYIQPVSVNAGNVSSGETYFNNIPLYMSVPNGRVFYEYNSDYYSSRPRQTYAEWKNDGFPKFKELDLDLGDNFPVFSDEKRVPGYFAAKRGAGLLMPNPVRGHNSDSVYVLITNYNNDKLKKILSPNEDTLFFSPRELAFIKNNWTQYNIYASNYFYKTINGKTYLFELSTIYRRSLQILL